MEYYTSTVMFTNANVSDEGAQLKALFRNIIATVR